VEGAAEDLAVESTRLRAIEGALPKTTPAGVSLWQSIREAPAALVGLLAELNVSGRIAALRDRLADLADHVVRLIALLLLETIIFPLVALWCLLRLFRLLGDAPQEVEIAEPSTLPVGLGLWPR
jgi:hypothetical protein